MRGTKAGGLRQVLLPDLFVGQRIGVGAPKLLHLLALRDEGALGLWRLVGTHPPVHLPFLTGPRRVLMLANTVSLFIGFGLFSPA